MGGDTVNAISFIHDNFTFRDMLIKRNADTNWFNDFDDDIKLGLLR